MDALINLKECKEYMTITLNSTKHNIRLSGTVEEPYFCGKDVCEVLGYDSPRHALQRYVDDEEKESLQGLNEREKLSPAAGLNFSLGKSYEDLSYHNGKTVYISEAGLYSLIMSSQAPFAKEFRKLVCKVILPSIRKYGTYSIEQQLSSVMGQLSIKDTELEQERERANEACARLRSEAKRHKEQLKRTLEFNQATKCIEPLEYVYACTTEYYQRQHKFKVGGVQSFELLKSRLTQYNSGESNSEAHFFIYVRKTVSYRSIEHALKGLLSGFRENQSNELYIMHCDWLLKLLDAVMDGNAEFALLVNSNREQILLDTVNKDPTILPPVQLEQIAYIRAGDAPRDLEAVLGPEMLTAIKEAISSFSPLDNTVKRREFEDHLMRSSPSVKLLGKKREAWELTRQLGSTTNPMWRYKY